jgi:hypothetical protein
MYCQNCKKEALPNREICPVCYHPIKPIPIPSGGKIRFGEYDWYVLDRQEDKVLIQSEKIIEKRAYHNCECEITWETSDMRKYLNGEFYNSFSAKDRKQIIEVTHENNDNPWYGTSGGNPTTDRIFLLSVEEVVQYFGDSGQLKTKNKNSGCDWCKDEFFFFLSDQYNIARRAVDDSGVVYSWRLRSPGANGGYVAIILGDTRPEDDFDHGDICIDGWGGKLIDGHMYYDCPGNLTREQGVRPALWLSTV